MHRVQRGQGFNSPGELEIPESALEELLVNALVHRDYFTSASIRILIFTDRVEIISPGHLPDSLSVEDVRLGSGVPRALAEWPRIELVEDVTGNQFSAVIQRPEAEWASVSDQVTDQVTREVLRLLSIMQGDMSRADIQAKLELTTMATIATPHDETPVIARRVAPWQSSASRGLLRLRLAMTTVFHAKAPASFARYLSESGTGSESD